MPTIPQREQLFAYAAEAYGTAPDFPWRDDPDSAVLRHADSGKWYALITSIPPCRLGLANGAPVDILDLKGDPLAIGSLIDGAHYFPAYHMNKTHWLTVLLDGSVPLEQLAALMHMSYTLTQKPAARVSKKR